MKTSGSGVNIGLFRFSISSVTVLISCNFFFKGICPFHLSCWIFWHKVVCRICSGDLCLISGVGNLCFLFHDQSCYRFISCVPLFKEPMFGLVNCLHCFLLCWFLLCVIAFLLLSSLSLFFCFSFL